MANTSRTASKSLAVRQQLVKSSRKETDDAESESRHVTALVEKILKPNKAATGTVDEVLNHAQVKKHGRFGWLSSSQQNLVTSVVTTNDN